MITYIISKDNLDAFNKKNIKDANVITDISDINATLQNGNVVYIDSSFSIDQKKTILDKLNLFVLKSTYINGNKKVTLFSQAIFDSISSYTTSALGSQAKDVLEHSALVVEKVAREAYTGANSFLLNVDNALAFASSNLWRKVVNNINEDYPVIELMNLEVENFNIYFQNRLDKVDTILCDPYIRNIVNAGIIQTGYKLDNTVYLNDFGTQAKLYKV